jgi:hypothetical protein
VNHKLTSSDLIEVIKLSTGHLQSLKSLSTEQCTSEARHKRKAIIRILISSKWDKNNGKVSSQSSINVEKWMEGLESLSNQEVEGDSDEWKKRKGLKAYEDLLSQADLMIDRGIRLSQNLPQYLPLSGEYLHRYLRTSRQDMRTITTVIMRKMDLVLHQELDWEILLNAFKLFEGN